MNRTVDNHLTEAMRALELVKASFGNLVKSDKVDAGARIRALKNMAEAIDKALNEEIKIWRAGTSGSIMGAKFTATLTFSPVTRVDQGLLELNHPRVHKLCLVTRDEGRITYSLR